MRVPIIDAQGRTATVEQEELQDALSQGFKLAPQASHAPGQDMGVQLPPKPNQLESLWRGAMGIAGGYEGGVGRGKYTVSPVTGTMVPLDPNAMENIKAEKLRIADSAHENPGSFMVGSFLSPESLAAGEVGGALKAGMQAGAIARAPITMQDFGKLAALRATLPTIRESAGMAAGSFLGPLGKAGAAIPYAARVVTDPRVDYQAAKVIPPAMQGIMSLGGTLKNVLGADNDPRNKK